MGKILKFAILNSSFLSLALYAAEPVIYGADGRMEVYEASPSVRALARSTAVRVSLGDLTLVDQEKGLFLLDQTDLKTILEARFKPRPATSSITPVHTPDKFTKVVGPDFMELGDYASAKKDSKDVSAVPMCAEERFQTQPTTPTCSGFLIAQDLLMTAGHCMDKLSDCTNNVWIFDYQIDPISQTAGIKVPVQNIYTCAEVIRSSLIEPIYADYAIIKLNRVVPDRNPLEFRRSGKIKDNAEIFVIGAPYGLPTKVTMGANVRDNSLINRFSANLDTYSGNSGSGVFDAKTGILEGILVEGETDFVVDVKRKCIQSNYCPDTGCRGEKITRINSIPEISYQRAFFRAAQMGDVDTLKDIMELGIWVDIYAKDGQSALLQATSFEQEEAVDFLIEHKANVNLKDAEGNTALHLLAKKLSAQNAGILESLVVAKAVTSSRNSLGDTALHVAAENLNLQGVKLMLKNPAFDKNITNYKGETVLFAFARMGNKLAYQELVKLGVNASLRDKVGKTAADYLKK